MSLQPRQVLAAWLAWLEGPKCPHSHGWQLVLAAGWGTQPGCWLGALVLFHVGLSVRLVGFPYSVAAEFQERGFPESEAEGAAA